MLFRDCSDCSLMADSLCISCPFSCQWPAFRFLQVACFPPPTSDAIDKTSSVRHQSSRRIAQHSTQTLAGHQPTPPTVPPNSAFPPVPLPEKSRGKTCPHHVFGQAITFVQTKPYCPTLALCNPSLPSGWTRDSNMLRTQQKNSGWKPT
jgi:hypothetical protein